VGRRQEKTLEGASDRPETGMSQSHG
jgi:hypothetical protein